MSRFNRSSFGHSPDWMNHRSTHLYLPLEFYQGEAQEEPPLAEVNCQEFRHQELGDSPGKTEIPHARATVSNSISNSMLRYSLLVGLLLGIIGTLTWLTAPRVTEALIWRGNGVVSELGLPPRWNF